MGSNIKNSVLLNEHNWNDIIANIDIFPFRISEINLLNKEIKLSKVSFKYNINGKETYYNGKQEVTIQTGEYIVATNQFYGEVKIAEYDKKDIGVCVDINVSLLQQAIDSFSNPYHYFSITEKSNYFLEDDFFIKYKSNKAFHHYMQTVFQQVKTNSFFSLEELECEFVKQFVFHQWPHLKAYKSIPAIKKSTRNELFSKMMNAKNNIHDSLYSHVSMTDIAKDLLMSEYRFFHLFKETFQVSPHRYMVQLKMDEAIRLFVDGKHSWTEIAALLQFADVQTFSKMFKKHFLICPKAYADQLKSFRA
ncbi:MAG: helix-turn-helix transcriptional regulator [Bacteroidetes bacterium]|nr:helix-turn-helix transcriptional regulator [Bacteroidota bacterium]